ncbi:AraC family transcriptional regulator [Flavobacterium beibuense]|uniref:AraC family transcriptional regulator n=1 Tax=Flavobacterium beibuense TaxID=657326 RepID=UPI003A8F1391
MRRLNQFETLVIHEFEEDKFHLPAHTHTYYELIYIVSGYGIHELNDNMIPYKAGDLFALAPEDRHYFDIKSRTRFVYIKFTDSYFSSKKNLVTDDLVLNTPQSIMREKMLKETLLKLDEPCATILKNTVNNITAYNCRKDVSTSPIVFYQILSIFGLIRETVKGMELPIRGCTFNDNQVLSYIHENIYSPKSIQSKAIAQHFNIAQTYFSAYFKRNFGITYRDYINNLKVQLIEKRIAGKNMPIKQIAYEFGFTDESHLTNYFKKHKKMKPSEYVKNQ